MVVKDRVAETSQDLVDLHLVDAELREAWMPYFCRSGHPVATVEQFLGFVDPFLPQEPVSDLLWITGQDLLESPGRIGWVGLVFRACHSPWYGGNFCSLPQGFLDVYIALIRKVDGDSTPVGKRPLCVLSNVKR